MKQASGRIIPVLLMSHGTLVKTRQFKHRGLRLVGDPINSLKIFNELEVDELCLLDISASSNRTHPNFDLIEDATCEIFMPIAYGGGIRSVEQAEKLISCGIEKVVLNSGALDNPDLINEIALSLGSQAVVVSVDVKFDRGRYFVLDHRRKTRKCRRHLELQNWLQEVEARGAGELLVTATERECTWQGADTKLIETVMTQRSAPVVYQGGVASIREANSLIQNFGLSGVAVGSLVVFSEKDGGVLVHMPAT